VAIFGKVSHAGSFSRLTLGDNSTLNHGVFLNLENDITIGNNVHISPYAQLHTGHLVLNEVPRYHLSAPIIIEDHVWIASGAIIGAGVRIGQYSVVAANSVVTKDVPPSTLVGGVPARVIRQLTIREH